MSVKDLYPAIRPSLNLDFANTKTLDPRITFSRASTGTYYDGVTHAKAEENLLTYSQEFDNAAWDAGPNDFVVSADATTAPDGTSSADKIIVPNGSALINAGGDYVSSEEVSQNLGALAEGNYTFSIYAKIGEYSQFQLRAGSDSNLGTVFGTARFNLSDGSIDGTPSGIDAGSTSVGNGWYRLYITFNKSTSGNIYVGGWIWNETTPATGNGSDGSYLRGAQIEQRDSLTAYTATTTQPITNYIPVLQSAAAGEARFDHDPVTGESKGLLIEEQRTNLLTYSEEFDNAAWTKTNVSIDSNVIVAPDGTLTGDKASFSVSGTTAWFYQDAGTSGSASLFVKYIDWQYVKFRAGAEANFALFDLINGTVSVGGTISQASITPVGNGWYRIWADVNQLRFDFRMTNSSANDAITGSGSVYIWGAQVEAGDFPTSYIKTTSAQATRSADSASMTGTNFSEWYRQDEGTLYGDVAFLGSSSSYPGLFGVGDGTNDNGIDLVKGDFASNRSQPQLYNYIEYANTAQTTQTYLASGNYNLGDFFKVSLAYKANDAASSYTGQTAQVDTSANIPLVNTAFIGRTYYSGMFASSYIKKLAYYPLRLTNAQLQALTEG